MKAKFLKGAAVGAATMYFLDKDTGGRRRALVRDKAVHIGHDVEDLVRTGTRDLKHRTQGVVAETSARLRPEEVDDAVIEARVRTQLGRLSTHPGAIEVSVENGSVTLAGPVLSEDADRVVDGVARIRGVQEVCSCLEIHETAGNVPGLQGRPHRVVDDGFALDNSPAGRLAIGVLGGAVMLKGRKLPGPLSKLAALAGLFLLASALESPLGERS